ncbi:MAG: alpha-galactosidase [Lachnospiraceae bacterium]|nr:alpha-galactosidase [Lachnospiraceae bacterium]
METIRIDENSLHVVFWITEERELKLVHFSPSEFDESLITDPRAIKEAFQVVQLDFAGYDRTYERHGNKTIVTSPGIFLKYVSLKDERNETGRKLTIIQEDREHSGAYVTTEWQFMGGLPLVRVKNTVENRSDQTQALTYISSFALTGIGKECGTDTDEKMVLWVPHNGWMKEMNWRKYSFHELGLNDMQPCLDRRSSTTVELTNTGHWSTKKYLPMGYLENGGDNTAVFWQIEHNGSWHAEISDQTGFFYLTLSGPTEVQSHWHKELKPGESFQSVPVAVGSCMDDFDTAMAMLTEYRRKIRRKNDDNKKLPVIFNDYMNCLFGDPTMEKEIPLIDAAALAGCEYYVIDAGWYADGFWWDTVGEWQESRKRFPEGIRGAADYIRSRDMIPGVWLEIEVMGIHCALAKELPDDWFFLRHGKRVYDRSRYQLDFRNEKVREYASGIIRRLVEDCGIGYIKMDYNIEPGIGTELNAESPGEGLLEHERAYLAWLDEIFQRYPELVIENCSSGGLRMDYAMLSRLSIQSTSDQEDYVQYSTIAANAPAAVTPEQAAVWSYPRMENDEEETVFNMVNAMLLRIHQSGHLAEIARERFNLVMEGIACYQSIRHDIKKSVPFWPLGLADSRDEWAALGLKCGSRAYLAVWRRHGNRDTAEIPIEKYVDGEDFEIRVLYPAGRETAYRADPLNGCLKVHFPQECMARLFEIVF